MATREGSALSWIESKFSEGFLGKMSAFLREEPGKEFLKGPEDPSRDLSLKEDEGVATGIARLVKLYAMDYPAEELKHVSGLVEKAKEGKFEEMPVLDVTRAALWGFLGGGGEGVANLGLAAYEKEFGRVAVEGIRAMRAKGIAPSKIKKVATEMLEFKRGIKELHPDTFSAVDVVGYDPAVASQALRTTHNILPERGVTTTHLINPEKTFRPKGVTHEAGHAMGSKVRFEGLDIGLGAKEKAIFAKQQELRDPLLRRYQAERRAGGPSELEGGFALHDLSPAELHAEAIAGKIEAAYPDKLSMKEAFKQTLEATYEKGKAAMLRKGEWPEGVRLLEGAPEAALGATLMARIGKIRPEIKLKFDGVQEGFGSIPEKMQFTPYAGPLKGRTFTVPKGSSPEDVLSHMEKMKPSTKGGTTLREGGSKAPWVWSLLERSVGGKGVFGEAKEMKGLTALNKLKKAGVSDAELEWTGLRKTLTEAGEKPVDLDMLRGQVWENRIKTDVVTSKRITGEELAAIPWGETLPEGPRHESMFVNRPLPKAESGYRESLVTLKHEGKTMELPEHYDADNVVVGMLADIRKTSEGSKALHLQEGQSDWARRGRSIGFEKPELIKAAQAEKEAVFQKLKDVGKEIDILTEQMGRAPEPGLRRKRAMLMIEESKLRMAQSESLGSLHVAETGVPNMPFKGDKALELGLKRMLWEASSEGAEKLTWTRGKDIADRWSLRQVADKLRYDPEASNLIAEKAGTRFWQEFVKPEKLGSYVGEDVAKTLLEKGQAIGPELEVGKRWPYEIYDKKIPAMLKKLTREVGEEGVPRLEGARIPKMSLEAYSKRIQELQQGVLSGERHVAQWKTIMDSKKERYEKLGVSAPVFQELKFRENALEMAKERLQKELKAAPEHPVHSLDLPESLRLKIQSKGFKISRKVALQALEGIA